MRSLRAGLLLGAAWVAAVGGTCCCPPSHGQTVSFGDQTTLVVWNPATRQEHFVRQAVFSTKAADFAFIAPTPNVPELALAESHVFELLESLAPKTPADSMATSGLKAAEGEVQIAQERDLGQYHAVTLSASDNTKLNRYLQENGYSSSPDIEKWTKFYVAKGWFLTAFKLRVGVEPGDTYARQGTVRMSFQTDVPFNPYRVPDSNRGRGSLNIYFVSNGPYQARVGKGAWRPALWDASVSGVADQLASAIHIPKSDLPANLHITRFREDDWTENPSEDDITFVPSPPLANWAMLAIGLVTAGLGMTLLMRSLKAKAQAA